MNYTAVSVIGLACFLAVVVGVPVASLVALRRDRARLVGLKLHGRAASRLLPAEGDARGPLSPRGDGR